MADKPVLICTGGALAGSTIEVPEGGLDLGRADENHVVIRDDGVSRFHARLLFENGSLWLQDAGSRNGVFVNGHRVSGHVQVKVGDTIAIAQHTFEVRWGQEGEKAKAAETPASAKPSPAKGSAANPASAKPEAEAEGGDGARRRWFWPFS